MQPQPPQRGGSQPNPFLERRRDLAARIDFTSQPLPPLSPRGSPLGPVVPLTEEIRHFAPVMIEILPPPPNLKPQTGPALPQGPLDRRCCLVRVLAEVMDAPPLLFFALIDFGADELLEQHDGAYSLHLVPLEPPPPMQVRRRVPLLKALPEAPVSETVPPRPVPSEGLHPQLEGLNRPCRHRSVTRAQQPPEAPQRRPPPTVHRQREELSGSSLRRHLVGRRLGRL